MNAACIKYKYSISGDYVGPFHPYLLSYPVRDISVRLLRSLLTVALWPAVQVVCARGVLAMDLNGLSDPYCKARYAA